MKRIFETDGTHNGLNVSCPINDFSCPYCDVDGHCHISNPLEECNVFGMCYESWDEYEAEEDYDIDDDVDETGFNPFTGGYDYDC